MVAALRFDKFSLCLSQHAMRGSTYKMLLSFLKASLKLTEQNLHIAQSKTLPQFDAVLMDPEHLWPQTIFYVKALR